MPSVFRVLSPSPRLLPYIGSHSDGIRDPRLDRLARPTLGRPARGPGRGGGGPGVLGRRRPGRARGPLLGLAAAGAPRDQPARDRATRTAGRWSGSPAEVRPGRPPARASPSAAARDCSSATSSPRASASAIEGVDFSPEAIAEARRGAEEAGLARRLDYRVEDINAIRLPASRYDIVFFHGSLHHIRNVEHVLEEVRARAQARRPPLPRRVHGPVALGVDRRALGLRAQRLRRAARGAQEPAGARDPAADGRSVRVDPLERDPARRARASSRSSRTGPTAATSSGSCFRAWTWRGCARTRRARSRG